MDKEVRQIGAEELKTIQLDVLQAIDKFCADNGIVYSLACGTMLGAVRHKGYIPWDDDIDIYLLREDYIRLIKLFPKTYLERYELVSLERDAQWTRAYAKAFDNRTRIIEKSTDNIQIGVNIDVYPIDDVPDEESEWLKYDRRRRFFQRVDIVKSIRISSRRGILKNATLLAMKLPLCFLTRRHTARFLSWYSQKNNGKGYTSVFECVQGMLQKHKFSKTLFSSVVKMPFEDRCFMGFEDYDSYLRNAYGDYMQLPPEEKRISHHDFAAFLIKK